MVKHKTYYKNKQKAEHEVSAIQGHTFNKIFLILGDTLDMIKLLHGRNVVPDQFTPITQNNQTHYIAFYLTLFV